MRRSRPDPLLGAVAHLTFRDWGPIRRRELDQRDRALEHPLESVHADALAGLVVPLGAVCQVRAREAGGFERVRVRSTSGDDLTRLVATVAERRFGEPHLRCARPGAIAREHLL